MDRLLAILMGLTGPWTYLLIFGILLACGLGLPIPEDITLFAAGLISYYGSANVWWMIVISFVGVMTGDTIIFLLGAKYGRRITRRKFFAKILHEDQFLEAQKRFRKWGNKMIFAARFMPGLRAPIFFTAGTLHLPFRVFFFYDGLAAMLSVPAIVYSVYHFGHEFERVIKWIKRTQGAILFTICVVIALFIIKWYVGQRLQKKNAE